MLGRELSLRSFALLFLAIVGLALPTANCSGNGIVPADAGGDVAVNACGNGAYKMCSGTCVDVQGDPQNCGDCGKACPSSQVCSLGECADVCGNGTIKCNGNCIDLKSDPAHCGGCTNSACPSGEVCNVGTCTLSCQQGLTDCSGACVDLTSDHNDCGACGNACLGGQDCVGGTCQATCQSGWTSCPSGDAGTTCVDTQTDPQNCNGCGKACMPGYFCSGGVCGLTCAGGTSKCGGACVDESIDPNNCGGCNKVCGAGYVCSGANCCADATPYYCGGCDTFANCVKKSVGHIVAGSTHTCGINGSGVVKCWGYNGYGQLGSSSFTTSPSPVAVTMTGVSGTFTSLTGAYYGTCGVTTNSIPYCWGANFYGQLGNNSTTDADTPQAMCAGSLCSSVTNASAIGGSGYYGANCVLLKTGQVECAGYDPYGECCLGSITSGTYQTLQTGKVTTGASIAGAASNFEGELCAILTGGSVECWGYGSYSLGNGSTYESGSPVAVTGISNAVQVAVGGENVCMILQGGALYCWGYGYYGANGDGTTTTHYTPVATTLTNVVNVSLGSDFTCAVTAGGAVECAGYNYYGELGNGTTSSGATTTWQTAIASGAVSVAAGADHACALMGNGQVYCWGYNGDGQLGNGTYTDSSTPVLVSSF